MSQLVQYLHDVVRFPVIVPIDRDDGRLLTHLVAKLFVKFIQTAQILQRYASFKRLKEKNKQTAKIESVVL